MEDDQRENAPPSEEKDENQQDGADAEGGADDANPVGGEEGEAVVTAERENAVAEGEPVTADDGLPSSEAPQQEETAETEPAPADNSSTAEIEPAPAVDSSAAGANIPLDTGETMEKAADGQDPKTRGDEDEVMSEELLDDETPAIPDDFYYELEDHVSKAAITEDSGLPSDLLTLHHSFGYDCQKRSNLLMLDRNTCLFAAGNIAELVNLQTKEQTYLRSTSGGGIGAVAVHPSHKYFAIAEKGDAPNINLYEYPSLRLYRILRGGTQEQYAFISFSPDGKLLASVGGDPDYMLTVWDWKNEKTMLRSKAFSQDVYRVTFSADLAGQLTSSGIAHIRFWKMARTFTGLKLQGQLGKFGKTEISDIEGYVELPDGKVLSGSEGGNMLVWDGGLIKVEIGRKNSRRCHNGSIQQIIMDEGELMTIGSDGYIRVWDFETVDTADITDDSAIFEMEPMNELHVGNNVALKSIIKSVDAEEPTVWYAQDGNGGIWKLDLSFSFTSQTPEKLMSFHSGPITGCDTSPISHLVATTGVDKTVRVYDYLSKKQLCEVKYNMGGRSLLWAPKIVDPKGSTILVGFEDGVIRSLQFHRKEEKDVHGKLKDSVELVLKQAFKPHNGPVSAMAIDNRAEVLATGGADNSVFFLNINSDSFEPIGYVKVPSAVTHLEWSPGNFTRNTLLVCCVEGQVLEIECPDISHDNTHSYQLKDLNIRTHQFKSVKSRLRHDEELARKAKEEEERKKKEEEERRKRIERGLETESEHGEEDEEKKEEEEEWNPYIPEEPSPILHGFHGKEEGKCWISMGSFDAGYLYECQFYDEEEKQSQTEEQKGEPIRSIPIQDIQGKDIPISVIKFSKDRKRVILGLENGAVRIHPLQFGDISEMSASWMLSIHDNHYGKISYIASSYDDKYLFTVGSDGNFFTFNLMGQEQVDERVAEAKAKIPSARTIDPEKRIDDIQDPKAYSIEDAKQKSEHDKMMEMAEQKKAQVRRTIEGLRKQFRKLLEKNNELPEHLRLNRKEFELDAAIKKQLEEQTSAKIEQVHKEMAWEQEKCRVALDKLRTRFKSMIECERIVVRAFLTSHEVCSFRASKLPEEFYELKASMDKRKDTNIQEDPSRQTTDATIRGQSQVNTGESAEASAAQRDATAEKVSTNLKGSVGERINKALAKVEEKKRKRAARKAQWEELYVDKPDDNYEDPVDVAAIKEAKDNMGDYKLKSADDYVVPDHLRMNTDKAKAKLLVLKDLIHQQKYEFNQNLLSLRDKKIHIIEEIRGILGQLMYVQSLLSADDRHPLPALPGMHLDELPEKKLEYTRETLLKFKEELADREKNKGKPVDAFGGVNKNKSGAAKNMIHFEKPVSAAGSTMSGLDSEPSFHPQYTMTIDDELLSPLEKQLKKAEHIRLVYEQDQLLKKINDLLRNFDAELRVLRHEKFRLDIDLKNADLRQVTLFEELLLLKEFEKRENVLAAKLNAKQQERLDMQSKVIEVQGKVDGKKKDIEKLQEKERSLNATFASSLGDNNKFADYLTKVFKKKIKRSKKKASEGDGSDEDSEDESDDDSDWSDSDADSDSDAGGFDLDVCPSGCDQNLYDATCALREKRLDIEEGLAEEKKNRDTLNKELEALTKKAKVIDAGMKQAENELEAFQLEKQRKLNELDVVITLKLHQIQYTINNVLPQDLSVALLFEANGVHHLQHRIKELEHEKASQKKQQKDAKRKHIRLIKDRKVFDSRISEMQEQCDTMMLQKFGRIVDLEKIETVTVNRNVEELKEKLRVNEVNGSSELQKWEERVSEARDRITELIRENTNRLDQLNMLFGEKKQYQVSLDARQKNLGSEFSGERKSDMHERQRLIQLVHLQAQEVEALKEEITLLSRKGGHILPPAQPPLPPHAAQRPSIPNT